MNAIGHHAPDIEIGCVVDTYLRIERVLWNEVSCILLLRESLDGKFPVEIGHHNGVIPGVLCSVNHDDITITDSGILHGVTRDSDIKRGRGVSNHQFIQVKRRFNIIVSGRGESARDAPKK